MEELKKVSQYWIKKEIFAFKLFAWTKKKVFVKKNCVFMFQDMKNIMKYVYRAKTSSQKLKNAFCFFIMYDNHHVFVSNTHIFYVIQAWCVNWPRKQRESLSAKKK